MELYEVLNILFVVFSIVGALILVNIVTLWIALRMMTGRSMTKRFSRMYKKLFKVSEDFMVDAMKKLE